MKPRIITYSLVSCSISYWEEYWTVTCNNVATGTAIVASYGNPSGVFWRNTRKNEVYWGTCGIQKWEVGEWPCGYVTNLSSWGRYGEKIPHRHGKISFIPSFPLFFLHCQFVSCFCLSSCLVHFLSLFLPLSFCLVYLGGSVLSLQHSSDCHCCHPSHYISQISILKQLIIMTCFLHGGVAMGRRASIAATPGGSSSGSNIQFGSHLLKC